MLPVAGLAVRVAMTRPTPGPQVIVADLDRDGRVERVVLDPGRDPALAVWRGNQRLWQGVPRRWQPWKLKIADMDGDGRREIIVGVQKSTHFFPWPHHCLFIYRFDGRTVQPVWLGSSLSQPFIDFTFARTGSRHAEKLIALEITREGRRCVTVACAPPADTGRLTRPGRLPDLTPGVPAAPSPVRGDAGRRG